MTTHDFVRTHAHVPLIERLREGEPFAITFGGQGSPWLASLAHVARDSALEPELAQLVDAAADVVSPVARRLLVARPAGFDPMSWLQHDESNTSVLRSAAVSFPGVLLTQLAAVRALAKQGLDPFSHSPVAVLGHSQGVLAVESIAAGGNDDIELLAVAQLIGAAAVTVARRNGLVGLGDAAPMVAVSDVEPAELTRIVDELESGLPPAAAAQVSIVNGRRRAVLSGPPARLREVERRCRQIESEQARARAAKETGGRVFAPVFDPLAVEVGFHHPALADAAELVGDWAAVCGVDVDRAVALTRACLIEPVDWVRSVTGAIDSGASWILDLGPGDSSTRLTASIARGSGVGVLAAATRPGQRALLISGATPVPDKAWTRFAPNVVALPDGRIVVDTAFTRATGRSPILLAGMTPTTVDAEIVTAAANAGHWAELAGGGQVTEDIFEGRVAELRGLLEPGRSVQFNALFLDPYLWKLQLGGKRLLQRARAAGAPFDGVVISAGIPELDDAVALVHELADVGVSHIAFKPGTVDQIRSVLRIANEVPDHVVLMHVEGGHAGGHHSWEDLDDLLLDTYAETRTHDNVILCVGGGIGTPERATEFLTGTWSAAHGYPVMPVDGVLVGTAAMATLEATTSEQVKRLLVDTQGTTGWVGAGTATGGIASGRSQLGADIHEVDNAASRSGRLLDDVAGDADAVAARRDEIVAALDRTAKPYFGDVESMTYGRWLDRYVELAVIMDSHGEFDCGCDVGDALDAVVGSPWLDVTWRDRFAEMLRRTEARLHPADNGPIPTSFTDTNSLEDPMAAVRLVRDTYPDADTVVLHPADVSFFVDLCKTPGKPVNFVPVIDGDVRRWWRSDSLWQAHDARYSADQVCVIPGTTAVAGITRMNEPVGELLNRFETATADALLAAGERPRAVAGRRFADAPAGVIGVVLAAPDVFWSGRTTANPVRRLGVPQSWTIEDRRAIHSSTGAELVEVDDSRVELSVPMGERHVRIVLDVPRTAFEGGAPVVSAVDAERAMTELLAVAAGQELPTVKGSTARINVAWSPESAAAHTGVTATGLSTELGATGHGVPDVIVGACWPAVFAVLGAARTGSGTRVIEGMLDLVHLDHQVQLHRECPSDTGILTVRARSTSVHDTEVGRVVEVRVEIGGMDAEHGLAAPALATLVERFAIRGRTGRGEFALVDDAASQATPSPRRRRRSTTIAAPTDMRAFAEVSGDHNPIHTSNAAAALAGLDGPIVHGMWLSAAAQQVVAASDADAPGAHRRLISWTARFVGMVAPGAQVEVTVDRIAQDAGADIVEVTCTVDGDPVLLATGRTAPPVTAYAFPGQGIQRRGMGLDARARSKAARRVWDRADAHTRTALGFSILAVVRDNPTQLWARGVEHRHPDGVLHLTQFTQVAMATLGVAQVAELRESNAFTEGAVLAGHSVGEYNALAAIANVLSLEALLEVVFQRGSAMHDLVPRDEHGRSDYRMAAIRPSQIGLSDEDVRDFVAAVAERSDQFLEVVNLNLRGSQYAVAGTVAGLAALEKEIESRRVRFGGKRAFVLVPGIDVPFHSTVLRTGVPEFRATLLELLPTDLDPQLLVGRYVPNLVPKPFSLDRSFVTEIADLVPSDPLRQVLAEYDYWTNRPHELCRIVLVELLAWQFASPVRWIETQDLLFTDRASGGLGVERFVEVGVGAMPTVANLAGQTLAQPEHAGATVEVLNIERDAAVVFGTDTEPPEDPEAPQDEDLPAEPTVETHVAATTSDASPRPDDIPFTAADATRTLVALWTKLRPEQIGPVDTIEGLCDGVSSRRNQLLVDLGSELSLGAMDGAAEADMTELAGIVEKLARTYQAFGPVLTESIGDRIRKALGPSGRRADAIGDRVRTVWQLGEGWARHVHAEVALGTRDGVSVRGGDLGGLSAGHVTDGAAVDAVVDTAVTAIGARRGITVTMPRVGDVGAATVDAAALGEFADQITGQDGVLASAARLVLDRLGLDDGVSAPERTPDHELIAAVAIELGSDWPRLVAPAFDARRVVLFDDRWASAREDLVRIWVDGSLHGGVGDFSSAGRAVAAQARWWSEKANSAGHLELAAWYDHIADGAERPVPTGRTDVAVVTGASPGSIAAAVTGQLLAQGATVFVTTSRLDDERLAFYRDLYRNNARADAALWVVPANMASYADIDALVEWIGSDSSESAGGVTTLLKPAMTPTLLFPFAAPRVAGELADAGAHAEMEMRVLLWSVERLIGRLSTIGADHDVDSRLHVVLPGSPNRGTFGGDGAYGESKAALDAVVARWSAEPTWAARVTLAHALIGWVRGTGLMGHNDPLVDAVEAAGVRTWSTAEMAEELIELCATAVRATAEQSPVVADLTGGLRGADLDLAALARQTDRPVAPPTESDDPQIAALPAPPSRVFESSAPEWGAVDADPADLVVVVGAGELGPYGSARTRFEMEVDERLSAAGVLELAWSTGLVTWENEPTGGWYDADSGELVPEADIADRYHDDIVARCGIRRYEDDGAMVDNSAPLLASVFLDRDLTFSVRSEAEARAFASADPDHTVVGPRADGDWTVTRKAGTEIRVPRRTQLSRTVGGQIPTGFDPTRWGISPDMASTIDRVALWNIVTTVDAFVGAGVTPAELMRWVHPSMVANTQGTGMGGMNSLRGLYIDALLGESRANDILQEALPNVVAAHVVQSYVGSYGAMVHPVAACATVAVSVEEGVDKITLGKADFVVAGGFDDIGVEGIVGFGDMAATADSDVMSAKGIDDRRFSRANDRRRGGFVESHGGGTVLLARGDIAHAMGLPVLGVVAHAQSFGDGVHTSIPAPGIGALGAARGGTESRLAMSLRRLGVTADDVAVISKHDTSTAANDPNEAELHERLAAAIGRSAGAPLFVVSQKSLTGHAKGGAAAFQLIGLCQVLDRGVVPPNRSLDCVDPVMAERSHLVWPRAALRFGDRMPLKAGLLTSLGFGHVSGLVAVVHPEAFVQSLPPEAREDYRRRSRERAAWGRQRLSQAMCGGAALYERPTDRRLGAGAEAIREREAAVLLDDAARFGANDAYESAT